MFELAWPWVLAFAPLPWLLRRWLPPAASQRPALRISFLDSLGSLAASAPGSPLHHWQRQWPAALIWLLLLVATARPQWLGEPLPIPSSGRDLLLAVDVSGSMEYADMTWQGEPISRLGLVKQLMGDFIDGRQGDRVGLILFGSQAYLQSPLTFDRQTVRTWLDEAVIGIAGKDTAIGDAIGLAIKRLYQQPANSRVLVLITDGANTAGSLSPQIAAELAAEQQVVIYTIGIGTDPGQGGLGNIFGFNPGLELDEDTLKRIAQVTGGSYFRARNPDELQQIEQQLDKLQPITQDATLARLVHPLYPWPLGLALLLSLFMVWRTLRTTQVAP